MKKLLYNGTIYTMTTKNETVEALILDEGNIFYAGNKNHCLTLLQNENYESIDLHNKVLLPGFIDSHLHIIGHGEKILTSNLSACKNKEEILMVLQSAIPRDGLIVAEGFHEKLQITKNDLDCWFPKQTVALIRQCYHTMLVNEAALQKWEVCSWNVPKNEIGRNADGTMSGYLYESAMQQARKRCHTYTLTYLEQLLETAIHSAHSYGITSIVTEDLSYYGDWRTTLQAFWNVLDKTTIKTNLLVHNSVWEEVETEQTQNLFQHPFIQLDSIKFFLDGSLGSRTAWLLQPYHDDSANRGIPAYSSEELETKIQHVRSKNKTVAFHVIGDASFKMALSILKKYPPALKYQKDRLIHLSLLPENGIKELKQLPVVLDLQPAFYASDCSWVMNRIGKERMKNAYKLSSFTHEGFICGGSSDAPIEEINPWLGIFAAIDRDTEALTLYEAISLYTKGSAATIHAKRGEIKVGFDADFQIYEQDPFQTSLHELKQLRPTEVYVHGQQVF